VPRQFLIKFPKKINRVKLSDNRDRNRVNSEIQSGYQKRPFSHTAADGAARMRGGGEPHVIGETVNEMLDHVSARPVSSHHPHLPALNYWRSPPIKSSSPCA
jgi:hypothetical protein